MDDNEPMPRLELDVEEYMPDYDAFDMTREQKEDHIRALWHMMEHFVDMAWGGPGFGFPEVDKSQSENSEQEPS